MINQKAIIKNLFIMDDITLIELQGVDPNLIKPGMEIVFADDQTRTIDSIPMVDYTKPEDISKFITVGIKSSEWLTEQCIGQKVNIK